MSSDNAAWSQQAYPLLAWLISLYPREDAVQTKHYTVTAFYCGQCEDWITEDWVAHGVRHLIPPAGTIA